MDFHKDIMLLIEMQFNLCVKYFFFWNIWRDSKECFNVGNRNGRTISSSAFVLVFEKSRKYLNCSTFHGMFHSQRLFMFTNYGIQLALKLDTTFFHHQVYSPFDLNILIVVFILRQHDFSTNNPSISQFIFWGKKGKPYPW